MVPADSRPLGHPAWLPLTLLAGCGFVGRRQVPRPSDDPLLGKALLRVLEAPPDRRPSAAAGGASGAPGASRAP